MVRDLSTLLEVNVYLKMEQEQRTGSFKLRGAHNKIAKLTAAAGDRHKMTVVTSSTGNHGLACLDAMQKHGIKVSLDFGEDQLNGGVVSKSQPLGTNRSRAKATSSFEKIMVFFQPPFI